MSERDEFEAWIRECEGHPFAGQFANLMWKAWQAARAPQAVPALTDERKLLEYVLQDDLHNRLTPRVIDIAYTAFCAAKQPNTEDGGPSDWFTDTRPVVLAAIEKLRKDLLSAPQLSPEPEKPEHAHDWRFSLQDHVYKCDCGATRGDYPFGAASFKD